MSRKMKGLATRVARRTSNNRWALLLSLVLVVAAGFTIVLAVHNTGFFELEGNVAHDTTNDWVDVYNDHQTNPPGTSSGAAASSFAVDGGGSASIFTGGGSKDPIDVNQWAWKDTGGLPDKDNLLHAFAARYSLTPDSATCPSAGGATCEVLFFGSDRFDNSGDAQQGFWFLQNPTSTKWDANGDGTVDTDCPIKIGGGTGFCDPKTGVAAVHRDGDLLVISNFSNGGTTSTISVYQWNSAVSGNLQLLDTSDAALCGSPGNTTDRFCGIVNLTAGEDPLWNFVDKSGNQTYAQGELYEAGINLSRLGLGDECFSSVVAESRSSTSTTATLKDFVIGQLGNCSTEIKTTPTDVSGSPIPNPAGISITTAGSIQVKDSADLTVKGVATWSGTIKFFLCDLGVSPCTTGGTQIGPTAGQTVTNLTEPFLSDAATVTAAGTYCWRAEFTGDNGVPDATDASTGECFTVNPVPTTITTDAQGADSPGQPIGTEIFDRATLSGTANQPGNTAVNPTIPGGPAAGTITFSLYGPYAAGATPGCLNAERVTQSTATVNGDGNYESARVTPTAAGTYYWVASYGGNLPNTTGSTNTCGEAAEAAIIISLVPTVTTAQFFFPNDSATITVASGGGNLAGSVTFSMWIGSETCSGAANFTQTVTLGGTPGLSKTVETTNYPGGVATPVRLNLASQTIYWKVDYDSTNNAHQDVTGTCGTERSTITINNNVTP